MLPGNMVPYEYQHRILGIQGVGIPIIKAKVCDTVLTL